MRVGRSSRGRSWRALGLLVALGTIAPLFASIQVQAAAPAPAGGTIVGKVTDTSTGEPAEGALVVLACTCLDSERQAHTNAQGHYRFADLPPGIYSAAVFLGKSQVTKTFELARGQILRVNTGIAPAGDIRVLHVKPNIDMRGSSNDEFSGDELGKMAIGNETERDAVSGAIELTSTGGRDKAGPTTGGVSSAEMDYSLNGLRTNDPGMGTMALPLVTEFVQSVEVQEATYSAEYGSVTGGQVSARRLSGSNKLRGTSRFTFTPRLAKPRIITDTDNAVRAQETFDYGMQGIVAVSGPIKQDKLFWSLGIAFLGSKSTLSQSFWHRVDKDGSGGFEGCPYENGDNDCADGKNFISTRRFAEQRFATRGLGMRAQAGLDWAINRRHTLGATGSFAPAFVRRSYRRPVTSFDPDSLGASPTADPLGGSSTVANGIVNGQFGWDRSNATGVGLEYQGRVANDKVEIDAHAGYFQTGSDDAWRVDDPGARDLPATQEQDGQGYSLFEFLDREGRRDDVPGASEACNDRDLPGLSCPTRSWLSGGLGQTAKNRARSLQGDVALTHFFDTERAGSHQLKYGTQVEWIARRRMLQYSGKNREEFYASCDEGESGGGEWCFDAGSDDYDIGQPGRVDNHRMIYADTDNPDLRSAIGYGRVQYETGELRAIADSLGNGVRVAGYDATVSSTNVAAFVQDRWAVLSNLFLDVGVRWEGQDMRDVLGRRAIGIWDNVAPRTSVVYDWTEDGRSRLFASYGWFYQQLPVALLNRVHGGLVNVTRTYRDHECRGQEVALDGVSEPTFERGQPTEFCTDFGVTTTGLTEGATVPRLRGMYDQALQLGYEHEIVEDFTVGVRWLHRNLGRAVEDVSTNGGLDYVIANPGIGVDEGAIAAQRSQCEELDARLGALPTDDEGRGDLARELQRCEFLADAFDRLDDLYSKPTRNYDAFSLEMRKRYAKNWVFIGSYTYSRLVGNYEGFVDPTTGAINLGSSLQYNMPELVRNSFGALPYDTPHRLGLDGFYTFDLQEAGELTLGGSLRVRSGYPVSLYAGHNRLPGVYPIHVVPRGSGGRVEPNYQINASLQYAYAFARGLAKADSIGSSMQLAFGVRFFNVTNAKAALRVDELYSFQNTRPIAGGDLSDLKHAKVLESSRPTEFFSRRIVEPQGNFGVESSFQLPLAAQFDVMLLF